MSNALYRTQSTKELSQLIAIYLAFPPHCSVGITIHSLSLAQVRPNADGMNGSKDGSSYRKVVIRSGSVT